MPCWKGLRINATKPLQTLQAGCALFHYKLGTRLASFTLVLPSFEMVCGYYFYHSSEALLLDTEKEDEFSLAY